MKRVRFAPGSTGSLHVGDALSAVAGRTLGDWMLLRIDDTDPTRYVAGGEDALLRDLDWLGVEWDEGPVRQSSRQERYREAAAGIGSRFDGVTLLREDGSATSHLASVVDDGDFGITHVVRGNDHRPSEALHSRLHAALATEPPEYVHHGLILGDDGRKLAKRVEGAAVLEPPAGKASLGPQAAPTLARFRELRDRANGGVDSVAAKELLRELKAVGGDLHALRLSLTGRDRGPELAAVVASLDRDETLRRLDASV